jgi:hypothetical protein
MASLAGELASRLRLPALPLRLLAVVALAPLALGIGRLLPAEHVGLGLRLGGAAACVLLLPGALIMRALDWPHRLGLALAGALAWSLAVVFLAMVLMFAADGSLTLALVVVAVACSGGLLGLLRAAPSQLARRDLVPVAAVVCGGVVLGGIVWWASTTVDGDALFHLARIRKLDVFPVVSSAGAVNEFRDGSLHPGYAFPLWHGALALIGRIAAVDPELVVLYLSGVLAPLALVLAYAAGAALFASRAAGVAAAVAQATLLGFQRQGIGSFELTALPSSAARLLLVPAFLALAFGAIRSAPRVRYLTLALAGLVLAVVHVTYALFLAVPIAGFLVGRLLLSREGAADWRRTSLAIAALLVPTALFVVWLAPAVADTSSFRASASEEARALAVYGPQLTTWRDWYGLSPEAIARGGAATVAALLVIPAAAFAARKRWAAYVLGGSLAVLLLVLVPPFFTAISDLGSLSQARRLALFLPLMFALAGAAVLAGRWRLYGCAGALALGIGLQLAYPGGEGGRLGEGGPAWATWVALVGGAVALCAGRFLRREMSAPATWWATLAAVAFAVPIAVGGFSDLHREPPDGRALTPGLVDALRTDVVPRAIVFADLETSYRIAAAAPVYIAAAPPAHVADSGTNEPYERRKDVIRFFYQDDVSYLDKAQILRDRGATWLVVDKTRKVPAYVSFLPAAVYEDDRYALYPLRRRP